MKEAILKSVEKVSSFNKLDISCRFSILHKTLRWILNELCFCRFHLKRVQLHQIDEVVELSYEFLQKYSTGLNFPAPVIFTDEVSFIGVDILNAHNSHP